MEHENETVNKSFNRQSQQLRYLDNVSMSPSSRPPSYRNRMAAGTLKLLKLCILTC